MVDSEEQLVARLQAEYRRPPVGDVQDHHLQLMAAAAETPRSHGQGRERFLVAVAAAALILLVAGATVGVPGPRALAVLGQADDAPPIEVTDPELRVSVPEQSASTGVKESPPPPAGDETEGEPAVPGAVIGDAVSGSDDSTKASPDGATSSTSSTVPTAKFESDRPAVVAPEGERSPRMGGELVCGGRLPTIVGTDGDDTIKGTDGPDVIVGLGGDDVVEALGDDDIVCGGPGDDVIRGGDGKDRVSGQGGADRLAGQGGDDRLWGGGGDDVLLGHWGDDRLFGGGGVDELRGGGGDDDFDAGGQDGDACFDPQPVEECSPAGN